MFTVRRETLERKDQQQGWHDPARYNPVALGLCMDLAAQPPTGTPSRKIKSIILKTGVHGYLHLVCLSQIALSCSSS